MILVIIYKIDKIGYIKCILDIDVYSKLIFVKNDVLVDIDIRIIV